MIVFYPQGQKEPSKFRENKVTKEYMSEIYEPDTIAPEEFAEFEARAYQIDGCS